MFGVEIRSNDTETVLLTKFVMSLRESETDLHVASCSERAQTITDESFIMKCSPRFVEMPCVRCKSYNVRTGATSLPQDPARAACTIRLEIFFRL